MRPSRVRLRIWQVMIAVGVVAVLLALPGAVGLIVAMSLSSTVLATIGAMWLVFRGRRRAARLGFWIPAILVNGLFAGFCVAPEIYFLGFASFVWLTCILPAVAVMGVAWAVLATREGGARRRWAPAAWLAVIALTVLPMATVRSLWPLHLAFLAARPALERLADRVYAGQATGFPRWAGPFRVARTAVDPVTGNVGLMIDPNPAGPTGLVRIYPGSPPDPRGPFGWDVLRVDLGWGWEYREED